MKRALAALALAIALAATVTPAHAGGPTPPAKPQPHYYCVVVCQGCRNRCFTLPPVLGRPADQALKINRVDYR
jgi:hypothetical protein